MAHLSSEGMFLKDAMKTPDYKASVAYSSINNIIGLIKNLPEDAPERFELVKGLVEVRQILVENIDAVEDENKKIEYHKIIVDSDEFLPETEKSQEL